MIGNRYDAAVDIDRMQHGWRGTIKLAVFPIGSRLIGCFNVDRDGVGEFAAALEQRAGQAPDDLTVPRNERDRLALEPASAPQAWQEFFLNTLGALRRDELTRPPADHIFTHQTQALEQGVVNVQITPVLADGGRHDRRLAKQPLIVGRRAHSGTLYGIP